MGSSYDVLIGAAYEHWFESRTLIEIELELSISEWRTAGITSASAAAGIGELVTGPLGAGL